MAAEKKTATAKPVAKAAAKVEEKKVEEVKPEVKKEIPEEKQEVPECPPPVEEEAPKGQKFTAKKSPKDELDAMTSAELKEKAAAVGMDTTKLKGKKELRDALKSFFGMSK